MRTPEEELYARLSSLDTIKETAPSIGSSAEKELAKADPDFGTPVTMRNLFTHQETHPVIIDFALIRTFGPQWFGWDTATIFQEIQRNFASQISELSRAKIQAIKTLHVADGVWTQWQVFEKVIQALNGNIPKWMVMQAPSLDQLFAGVDVIDVLRREEYSDEVKAYMAAVVLNEDVFYAPPPLDFIQLEVSQPYYVCLDCGNEDSALFHDGVCDTCTHKMDPLHGLSFLPDPDLLAAGKGKNLKLHLKYNPDPVEEKWRNVSNLPTEKVDLEETQADVQVAKLLIARDYMNVRRRQLAEQLVALKTWLGST